MNKKNKEFVKNKIESTIIRKSEIIVSELLAEGTVEVVDFQKDGYTADSLKQSNLENSRSLKKFIKDFLNVEKIDLNFDNSIFRIVKKNKNDSIFI